MASERIVRCLGSYDLDPAPYRKTIEAFAERPLEAANGVHSHVSLNVKDRATAISTRRMRPPQREQVMKPAP